MADRRLYAILMRYFFQKLLTEAQRKKKGPKKKERGGPWNLPQLRKSVKVAFGNIFLDDFHSCLENPAGFSTATTGPAAVASTTELKTNGRSFTQNS
jgi:hypothetical protein